MSGDDMHAGVTPQDRATPGQAFYRHFKGRYYQVVGEALDTATEGRVVVYRTLYPSGHALFTRPYDEFHGWKDNADGQRVRWFTPVAYADLPDDARAHVVGVLELLTGQDGPSQLGA